MTLAAKLRFLMVAPLVALSSSPAFAQLAGAGVLDEVTDRFRTAASAWAPIVTGYATTLFVALAIISMVVTFGFMALRRADLGEFFAEFVRFLLFTGFFLWLLRNGPAIGGSIIQSMQQLGQQAAGLPPTTPSGIVDIGFQILDRMISESSLLEPVDSGIGILTSLVILVVLGLVGVNMILLLVSGWVLAYGGIFFLGFGGSRWTSDFAINYFKTVLGVAASLFAMVLVVGIGVSVLNQFYTTMSGSLTLRDMAVMLLVSVILLFLTNKIPSLVAGVLTGASVGAVNSVGNFGAATAFAAGSMAGAAIATGGAAMAGGAAQAAGGVSALRAAYAAAQQSMSGGSGSGSGSGGAGSSGGGGASGAGGSSSGGFSGTTPLGMAAGDAGRWRPGASTAMNLAGGAASLASGAAKAKIAQTMGGKVAERIRERASAPAFVGDSISAAPPQSAPTNDDEPSTPSRDEVAAFVRRND